MKRVARHLLTVATAFSLLACLITAALWLGYTVAGDQPGWTVAIPRPIPSRIPGPPPYFRTLGPDGAWDGGARGNPAFAGWEQQFHVSDWRIDCLGFSASRSAWTETPDTPEPESYFMGTIYYFTTPCWIVVAMTAILPLARLRRVIKAEICQRRTSAGRCPTCKYDLQATPDRCPECGTIHESNAAFDSSSTR